MTNLKTDRQLHAVQAPNAWRVVGLLAVANMLNFYDRTIPAILVEPIKNEFGLTDFHIGILSASFTVVYAVAGIVLGRMADRVSRRKIMGWGLLAWSLMTAASGGAWSFAALLIVRLGVGVGEASYAPAANSMIADLFPASKRSRAVAVFQLGLPIGLILAFFTTSLIADAFGSWRAPFFMAAIPGIIIALAMFFIREPQRGAADATPIGHNQAPVDKPIRTISKIPTMRWLVLSGIGLQIAANSVATFLVPLFQRYFGLQLTTAAIYAGIVLGVAGLIGLLVGGAVADRASRTCPQKRVAVGAISLFAAAPLTWVALSLSPASVGLFVTFFSLGWFLQFFFHTTALPAVSDVVPPAMRSTAIAIFFAAFYLLGGAFGPMITGALSEHFASTTTAGGISPDAQGLHDSLLWVVPLSLLLGAAGLLGATKTISADQRRMQQGQLG